VYQKGVLVCLLLNIGAVLLSMVLSADAAVARGFTVLILVGTGLASLAFVVLLAAKVYNPAVAVLLGLFSLFPCLNLLILLAVNGRATWLLRRNGHRVGLLGADLSRF
jgi:hypothetical protein